MSVEAVIATLLRGQHLLDRLTGGGGRLSPLAIVGLLWLPVLALALALAIREFRLLTAEADLASAQLTSAAAVTRDWFWAIDVEGRITYSSATSRAFVGFDPAELLGRSVLDLVHPDDVAQARAGLRQAVDTQLGWTDRLVRLLAADGGPLVVEQSAVAAFDPSGRFVGLLGSCGSRGPSGSRPPAGSGRGRRSSWS
jgi:PAS domain S-box-containing protein